MYDDCHMLIRNSKLLGKWAKLIKLDGEIEYFCTWKVEKIHIYANLSMYVSLNRLYLKVCDFFCKVSCLFQTHTFVVDQKMSRIYAFRPPLSDIVFFGSIDILSFFRCRLRLIDIFGPRNDPFLRIFLMTFF